MFENDDKKPRNHGKPRDKRQEYENDPYIHIEKVEPIEKLWIQLPYCMGKIGIIVMIFQQQQSRI